MEFQLQFTNENDVMKHLYKIIFIIAIMTVLNGCCLFETEFTEDDLRWLDVYNEGDTLIFRSSKGEMDTSWIVQKVIYYPACNPIAHHAKYKFQTGRIFYQNSKINYQSGGVELINVVKYEDFTYIHISYLNTGFTIDNSERMKLYKDLFDFERIEKDRINMFSNNHPKSNPKDIKFLLWHDDYGIIKYITHDSTVWKRINLLHTIE